jgi:conjugative transfer signal peptidase TraF
VSRSLTTLPPCRGSRLIRRLLTTVWIVGCAAMLIIIAGNAGRNCVWNLTPSVPRGVYLVRRGTPPARGALVTFRPSGGAAAMIDARHYLPPGVSLLKHVLALPGDRVCIDRRSYLVNGRPVGNLAPADTFGRHLDPFLYCGLVSNGLVFVGTSAPLSFDSRYFGPVPLSSLTVVEALWTF